jgi:hypothetical protein
VLAQNLGKVCCIVHFHCVTLSYFFRGRDGEMVNGWIAFCCAGRLNDRSLQYGAASMLFISAFLILISVAHDA